MTDEYTERLPGGYLLRQSPRHLRIGTDAVLLAENAAAGSNICDLGCGCGAVLMRMAELRPAAIIRGLELQADAARLCRESIELSGIADRASVTVGDLRDRNILRTLGAGAFDLVVCNPPYNRAGSGRRAEAAEAVLEREDATAPPSAVAEAAAYLLKNRGTLSLVLRADRLAEYIAALSARSLEPKRLTLTRTADGAPGKIVLLDAVKSAKPGLELREIPLTSDGGTAK